MNVENLLCDEIRRELEKLKEMEVGSEQHKETVDSVTKLTDRAIELEKIEVESQKHDDDRKDEQIDRLIRNCIAAAGIAIPSIITVWGTLKSLKFEEEGTVTTIVGRGFINKLLPKK